MKERAAVLGTGQTHHRSKRPDVSIAGLCREAVDRALADAGLDITDIDAVVVGKAPDLFEGVMMPELYLADALGAVGKPLLHPDDDCIVAIATDAPLPQAQVPVIMLDDLEAIANVLQAEALPREQIAPAREKP